MGGVFDEYWDVALPVTLLCLSIYIFYMINMGKVEGGEAIFGVFVGLCCFVLSGIGFVPLLL